MLYKSCACVVMCVWEIMVARFIICVAYSMFLVVFIHLLCVCLCRMGRGAIIVVVVPRVCVL